MIKQQALFLGDEIIEKLDAIYSDSSEDWEIRRTYEAMKWIIWEYKSRIQSLPDNEWMRIWDGDHPKLEWRFVWFTSDWDAVIEHERYWLARRSSYKTIPNPNTL